MATQTIIVPAPTPDDLGLDVLVIGGTTGTSYTIQAVDATVNAYRRVTFAGNGTIIVPKDSVLHFLPGNVLNFAIEGAGTATFTKADPSIVFNSLGDNYTTGAKGSSAQLVNIAPDVWDLFISGSPISILSSQVTDFAASVAANAAVAANTAAIASLAILNFNVQAGTSYTFGLSDAALRAYTVFTSGSAITATVVKDTTTAWTAGMQISGATDGAGILTFVPATGVTFIAEGGTYSTGGAGSAWAMVYRGGNVWELFIGGAAISILSSQITDFATAVAANAAVALNTAKVTNATHTGDVTGANALTIANNAVTNAKAAQMATKTYKGNTTGATANPADVPVATLKTDLNLVKADVGLGSVDNTADAAKPVSAAQAAAINALKVVRFSITLAAPVNAQNIPVHIAAAGLTINSVTAQTDIGTVTAEVMIGATDITGLAAIAVSSTQGSTTATAANVMVAGNVLRVKFSSASTPVNCILTFTATQA